MVGRGGVAVGLGVVPDFMAARGLAVEFKPEPL